MAGVPATCVWHASAVEHVDLILNRDLVPNDVPLYPVLQLEPPGGGHSHAWSRIWRFALTFDPNVYAAETGTVLLVPELAQKMTEWPAVQEELTGDLAELRAVLHWLYWQGGQGQGLPLGNVLIQALLDAIYRRVSGGQKRPAAETGPYEPALGRTGPGEMLRFWFVSRDRLDRRSLYDRVAGLLLRTVGEDFSVRALYLYPPSYGVDPGRPATERVIIFVDPNSPGKRAEAAAAKERQRLAANIVAILADRQYQHAFEGELPDRPVEENDEAASDSMR